MAGASLNHGQLSAARDPPRENHMPGRHEARLLPAYAGEKSELAVLPAENSPSVAHKVWLVRDFDALEQADLKAYGLMPGKEPIDIGGAKNRHPEWGQIYFCIVYERIGPRTFQAPPAPPPGQSMRPQDCVAVKRLKKSVVHNYLARGGQENPYREAARMQQIGDNEHVLSCIDFLQDKEYLYIVMPKAAGGVGTLKDEILEDYSGIVPFEPDELMEHDRVRQIFNKVLKILKYLEGHGICHRDMSPDNFLFLTDDNLVAFDLAMSIRIPVDDNGQRSLITPQGRCGTKPVMAPEIHTMQDFDGVAVDLWSASVLLYCLLTNNLLYYQPSDDDQCFYFFVTKRHLSNSVNAARMRQMAIDRWRQHHRFVSIHARTQNNMRPEILALFGNLLAPNPADRFSLADTISETERLCQAGLFP